MEEKKNISNKITALIILNYNNFEDTINCIESVEKYNSAPIKYIIIDNGSTRIKCAESINSYLVKKFSDSYLHLNDKKLGEIVKDKCKLPYVTYIKSSTNDVNCLYFDAF